MINTNPTNVAAIIKKNLAFKRTAELVLSEILGYPKSSFNIFYNTFLICKAHFYFLPFLSFSFFKDSIIKDLEKFIYEESLITNQINKCKDKGLCYSLPAKTLAAKNVDSILGRKLINDRVILLTCGVAHRSLIN